MNFDAETLKKHIPLYLSAEDQRVLIAELDAISRGGEAEYVLSRAHDEFGSQMLQGDGWQGFIIFSFDTGEKRSIPGLVLSNSCDLDPDNPRDLPTKVIFAPLARLASYVKFLEESGLDRSRIAAKVGSIKSQQTTSMFYLPAGAFLQHDYVIRLDEAQSMPVSLHTNNPEREKLFTLSNTGFYMLVLKLSIHFCRLQEKVNRRPILG
jgi:hypothetical protein